jgi:hypothetical protein
VGLRTRTTGEGARDCIMHRSFGGHKGQVLTRGQAGCPSWTRIEPCASCLSPTFAERLRTSGTSCWLRNARSRHRYPQRLGHDQPHLGQVLERDHPNEPEFYIDLKRLAVARGAPARALADPARPQFDDRRDWPRRGGLRARSMNLPSRRSGKCSGHRAPAAFFALMRARLGDRADRRAARRVLVLLVAEAKAPVLRERSLR